MSPLAVIVSWVGLILFVLIFLRLWKMDLEIRRIELDYLEWEEGVIARIESLENQPPGKPGRDFGVA